jgi:F-type H+-transporting ATPase subunit b
MIRSAYELPAEQRAAIQEALDDIGSTQVPIRFETAQELVAGIELVTNGQKIGWSISDYLASLEEGVAELLQAKDEPGTGNP